MGNSKITKKAIADTFKELMLCKPINKITVKEIIERCGISRRTFYNYYSDTYDLLACIYKREVIVDIRKHANLIEWKKSIEIMLNYTFNNKVMCLNTFNSLEDEYLERFLFDIFSKVIKRVSKEICNKKEVNMSLIDDASRFFALAIVGEFFLWLRSGLKEKPELVQKRIVRIMDGTLSQVLNK